MKRTLRRELFREIRKSLNRYLSILFIVMLGVAFFTGVRASEPDMRLSMDMMADGARFMDFRVLCSYGLTEEDLQAVRRTDGVSAAEGEYSIDVLERSNEKQSVLHVMSMTSELNDITLTEGRLPEKPGECLIDAQLPVVSEIGIGSVLHMESGSSEELSSSLKRTDFTVVGACTAPYYLDFERGSSRIGNGEVTGFVFVMPSEFCMDVYTQVYVRSDELKSLVYTSSAYEDAADRIRKKIEDLIPGRIDIRMEELTGDVRKELLEGREEYEKGRKEADEAFEKAEAELSDAENKLSEGKKELEDSRKKLENAKSTIEEKEKQLSSAKEGLFEEEASIAALEASVNAREQSYNAMRSAWSAAKTARDTKKRAFQAKELEIRITQGLPDSEARNEAISRLEGELETLRAELSLLEAELLAHPKPDSAVQTAIFADRVTVSVRKSQLEETRRQIQEGEAALLEGRLEYEKGLEDFSEGEKTLREKEEELNDARADYEKEKAETEKKLYDALTEIEEGEEELVAVGEPEWYVLGRDTVPSYVALDSDASRIGALGKVFPVIFFMVAALVSLTTMTRMVEEKRTEIGTMLALGYSTGQIAGKYTGYALSATLSRSPPRRKNPALGHYLHL